MWSKPILYRPPSQGILCSRVEPYSFSSCLKVSFMVNLFKYFQHCMECNWNILGTLEAKCTISEGRQRKKILTSNIYLKPAKHSQLLWFLKEKRNNWECVISKPKTNNKETIHNELQRLTKNGIFPQMGSSCDSRCICSIPLAEDNATVRHEGNIILLLVLQYH